MALQLAPCKKGLPSGAVSAFISNGKDSWIRHFIWPKTVGFFFPLYENNTHFSQHFSCQDRKNLLNFLSCFHRGLLSSHQSLHYMVAKCSHLKTICNLNKNCPFLFGHCLYTDFETLDLKRLKSMQQYWSSLEDILPISRIHIKLGSITSKKSLLVDQNDANMDKRPVTKSWCDSDTRPTTPQYSNSFYNLGSKVFNVIHTVYWQMECITPAQQEGKQALIKNLGLANVFAYFLQHLHRSD